MAEFNRIDSEVAVAEMLAAGAQPLEPYPGSKKGWRSRCITCDSEVSPMLSNIRKGTGPCWYCSGSAPLDPEDAVADMRAAGVEPLEPYLNAITPWRSRCLTCGNEVSPSLNSIHSGHGACRYCADYGFQYDDPGTVYLLRHNEYRALKVGITNDTTDRLAKHERQGWKLVDLWFFEFGASAANVEDVVLEAWSDYEYGVSDENMPQAGHTETVSLDDVTEAEAVALIEVAIAELPGVAA